jgi:hypothetical protein
LTAFYEVALKQSHSTSIWYGIGVAITSSGPVKVPYHHFYP